MRAEVVYTGNRVGCTYLGTDYVRGEKVIEHNARKVQNLRSNPWFTVDIQDDPDGLFTKPKTKKKTKKKKSD